MAARIGEEAVGALGLAEIGEVGVFFGKRVGPRKFPGLDDVVVECGVGVRSVGAVQWTLT